MIKLYGNEIWNSNTPNQYKKVIIASESQFESITDALENAGLNYCGYINKNKSYVAVGRATVPNLEKLNISYDSIVDSNNRKYVTNNIIGTTKYNDIGDKMYRKYNTDFAYKVAQRLSEQDIPFSGRIFGKNTTITVDNIYKDAINAIAHEIREQRELLYNDKAVEKNEPSATVKNSVTVSKEDNTENLFNALSVLHYKAHQLESLNSTVELLNNHPELIDTFSTMFEDTSDFKPEQLNMLSMNFVKTYSGLSDSELILANTADFNEIKQSFINTNLAYKLIENHGYSYAQSELIRDMVDMGIDYDTINLLDYTFSLTEMQTFIGAYSRSDYDSLINLVSKVKGVTRSEVEGMISDGTYTPALPDFNTLEKTLYFQESEAESITYMYYNPDAYSGGQFVITEVSYKQIAEANKEYGDDFSGFFDFLDTTGEQRLIDIGSESFRTAVKKFYSGTEFAEGLNADIQHKLVELAVVPEIKLPEVRKIELIKVGDFYEVRGENAKTVADILDLVSTTRNINGSSVDTVGFPDFKLNDNTELLKTQGFTVNIKYEGLVDLSNEFNKLISEQKKITSNVSDKHTIVINAFAGPGAGKTTSCLEVAEKLKKQGFVTEYVQEYAKELVYDNNLIMLDGHYEHQFAILNEQMKRINRLYGKVDFIVTDSPILLNNTYLNEDKNTEVYLAYSDSVNKLYGLYNNFNYFVERDKNNKPVRVLDVEATQVVQQKANAIRREFKNWIFKDANRRRDIVDTYNRTFNCVHAREYDGSHLNFPGMNSNIQLHEHQKNAIAHAIYGGNTLFAHSVGAGKTFEMIATAMECKRLGLCHKSLFAVPNHLTEQVGADFLKLYPNANILVATKDDFKSSNRKMLMSKIATGNYDAVIIGHTQLKMLPLSPERQEAFLQSQIDDIVAGLAEMKAQDGNKFTVKEMERTKKNLENQLEKLQSSKKDNTVYFEELGIDKLFVDEAHEFKNLYCATKLQNVSGISSRASQRATELFAKCRYLDEKTGGKGVVFATGTPLSNSVTELHTMMRYLNYDFLASHNNMQNFDNWISAFGVQKKEYELAPAGNKFKERTRIAEYSNLPELMSMFKMVADVKTAETLKLKVPDCELHIVDVEPTELQKELVDELSDRADEVNSGSVDPSQDNMLKITGDGRKLGLDPRLISPDFEDDPNTKLNVCVNNVFDIYTDTAKDKLTQIVFCDLGVPSKNTGNDSSKEQNDNKSVAELDSLEETGKFCVYDDIRDKLIAKGIPATEIAYIHNAKTEAQKSELFSKVRSGEVRILLGSTGKMGTGTNVQDRIIALHDLDVPWRPADLEQRRGRMVRQGNINEKVHLYRYVTKGTFDAYSYQLLETKQKFISQVMTDKAPARKCADVDQAALSYGEIKALCTGDDRIREKLTLDNRVKELNSLKADYNNTKYELEDTVAAYPEKRKQLLCTIGNIKSDIDNVKSFVDKDGKLICKLTLGSQTFNLKNDEERKNAAKALTTAVAQVRIADNRKKQVSVGNICGFDISVINNGNVYDDIVVTIKGKYSYSAQLGVSAVHNLSKIEGLLYKTESVLDYSQNSLNKLDLDYKTSVALLEKPFEYEAELQEKSARLSELTKILNIELAHQKTESKPKTHYFGKDKILGRNKSSKQVQNKTVMKSEPKRSEPEL